MCKNQTLFLKLRNSLLNTRKKLGRGLFSLFSGIKKIDSSLLSKLEDKLLISDIGVKTTKKIIDRLEDRCFHLSSMGVDYDIYSILSEEMLKILSIVNHSLVIMDNNKKLFIILVVGVNGVGKTSMIAKLAYLYRNEGKHVLLGAADTFRAAAVEQLQILGLQSGVSVVVPTVNNADPASVVFDAIQCAKSQLSDILIIDTAGRLQNKVHLMSELKKIVRVIRKFDECAPHEIMIVLDSTIGQNSVNQVTLFHECIGVTGIAMSKLDSTSKGGVLFSIVDQFQLPVRYLSFGKDITDFHVFDVHDFVNSIFD